MNEEDNIEGFFKNRLEPNQHFEFREEDWNLLETQLDAAAAQASGSGMWNKLKFWSVVLIFMVFTFLLGWFGHDRFSENEKLDKGDKTIGNAVDISSLVEDASCLTTDEEDCEVVLDGLVAIKAVEQEGKVGQLTKSSVELANSRMDESESTTSPIQQEELSHLVKNQGSLMPTIVKELSSVGSKSSLGYVDGYKEFLDPNDQFILLPTPLDEIDNSIGEKRDSIRIKNLFKDANALAMDRMVSASNLSKWSVGVTISPEMNSVGFAQAVKWSGQFGLGVFYRAFKNFTVSTGVGYTKKKYNTQGQKYKPYEGYWIKRTSGFIPDNVDGKCAVIDIPINFGYALNPNKRFYLDGVIGLSNYILLSETYFYEFDELNPEYIDQPISYGWQTKDNSNFLLSVLNVSIGVNWNINDRLVLTGSPYFKIPLKDIGYGNIPLHSSGTSFTLRYKFFRKEKLILK